MNHREIQRSLMDADDRDTLDEAARWAWPEWLRELSDARLHDLRDKSLESLKAATDRFFKPEERNVLVDLEPPLYTWETHNGFLFVCGPPWVHSMYMGAMENERLNAVYRFKLYDSEVDRRAGKYPSVILHSERPYRSQVLYALRNEMPDRDYWELLAHVWTDSENCWQNLDIFRTMFDAKRPEREYLMDDMERDVLADMPERIEIWHGVDGSEFAWTTNEKIALWFANRFPVKGHVPRVRHGFVHKEHVIAYFAGRGEDEIVVMPEHVEDMSEREVKANEVPTLKDATKGVRDDVDIST